MKISATLSDRELHHTMTRCRLAPVEPNIRNIADLPFAHGLSAEVITVINFIGAELLNCNLRSIAGSPGRRIR